MKQISPLFLKQKYFADIEREIVRLLRELIYAPLLVAAEAKKEIKNAKSSALEDAMRAGTVWHKDGFFFGDFNSRIASDLTSLGARYNARIQGWALNVGDVPPNLIFAQSDATVRYDALRRSFLSSLDAMDIRSIDCLSDLDDRYSTTIMWMNDDFKKAVSGIAIPPVLTIPERNLIADQWSNNLNLYVKKWAAQEILSLRQTVQSNAFVGRRAADLVQTIQKSYNVSKEKARFLARQETSLLLSKFGEARAKSIGAVKYRWSTSHDERVRHDHKDLNSKVFLYDSPPVTNKKTGVRNNPGCDFGCRCVAIPLID